MALNYSISTSVDYTAHVLDPISGATLKSLNYFYYPVGLAMTMFGTATNVINIVVYLRVGLKDIVSFSFFVLSVSDFCFSFLMGFICFGGYVMALAYPAEPWTLDIFPFVIYFTWYAIIFKDTTVVITAYIAIARCCLVAMPLRFKSIFTRFRTYVSLVTITVVVIILHVPINFTQGLAWVVDPRTNQTRVVLWVTDARVSTLAYHDMVNRNVIPYTSLAVIIISLVVMTSKLIAASNFRHSLSNPKHDDVDETTNEKSGNNTKSNSKLSARDVRVVKSVCSVAALYVVCILPAVMQSFARLLVPEFNFGRRYTNMYNLVLVVTSTISNINSAVNMFLYYVYNTRFREALISACWGPKPKG